MKSLYLNTAKKLKGSARHNAALLNEELVTITLIHWFVVVVWLFILEGKKRLS